MAELLEDGRIQMADGRVVAYVAELTVEDLFEISKVPFLLPGGPVGAAPLGVGGFVSGGGGGGGAGAAGAAGPAGIAGPQGPTGAPGPAVTFPLLAPSGSAAAPSYSFLLDQDTGMFRVGADILGFSAGGVESFRVTTVGATVTGKLTVTGAIDPTSLTLSGSTSLFFESLDGSGAPVSGAATGRIRYNDILARWEQSVQGGAYTSFEFTFPILAPSGTAAAPSYSFAADTNTGIFRSAADTVAISTGGVNRFNINTGDIASTINFRGPDGTALAPTYSFTADLDTGIFRVGVDQIGFSVGGITRLDINAVDIVSTLHIRVPDGTAAVPTYSSTGATDRGMFLSGVDQISFSGVGVEQVRLTSTQLIITGGGSTVTPGITFGVGDEGFFSAIADTISLTVNGTERLRFTSSQMLASLEYSFDAAITSGFLVSAAGTTFTVTVIAAFVVAATMRVGVTGTAALPSTFFATDGDTGIFRPAANQWSIAIGTAEGLRLSEPVDGDTALLIRRRIGGVNSLQQVSMGAVDSAGVGFKLIRVPN